MLLNGGKGAPQASQACPERPTEGPGTLPTISGEPFPTPTPNPQAWGQPWAAGRTPHSTVPAALLAPPWDLSPGSRPQGCLSCPPGARAHQAGGWRKAASVQTGASSSAPMLMSACPSAVSAPLALTSPLVGGGGLGAGTPGLSPSSLD